MFLSMITSTNGNIFRVTGLCAENLPVTSEFPAQRPVARIFHVAMICVWTNGWVNSQEAGDLRRHRAHYDVIVMSAWTSALAYWHHDLKNFPCTKISIQSNCRFLNGCQLPRSWIMNGTMTHLHMNTGIEERWSPWQTCLSDEPE